MDSNLTSAQAHKLFGELYRRQRSEALQEKVDAIVADTPDVYIRIKRIEELDRKSRTGSKSSQHSGQKKTGGRNASKTQANSGKKKSSGDGFLCNLFGGAITRWGQETGAINTGFLGLSHRISEGTHKLFRIDEKNVVDAIRCLRQVATDSWKDFDPERYNAIVITLQFFSEFVKMTSLMRQDPIPEKWINESFKLQKFYGTFLSIDCRRTLLNEDLPQYVENVPELSNYASALKYTTNIILELENGHPSLKNAILAYYILSRNKVETWENIAKELRIAPPDSKQYRAPKAVQEKIQLKISKLKEDYTSRKRKLQEVEKIISKYFTFDEKGRIKTGFLNEIIKNMLTRMHSAAVVTEGFIHTHKTETPQLLFIILRDFDLNIAEVLNGMSQIEEKGAANAEIKIFNQVLFQKQVEEVHTLSREIESFLVRNASLSYSFQNFLKEVKEGSHDAITKNFLAIVGRANKVFAAVSKGVNICMENHDSALQTELSGRMKSNLTRTKTVPIEDLNYGQRFLPFAEKTIVAAGRFNGLPIEKVLHHIAANTYNYLYIFRESELIENLSARKRLQNETDFIATQIEQMGEDLPGESPG